MAAKATEEANRISREMLIAEQRPWIALDVELASGIRRQEKTGNWLVSINVKLRNPGKTPATKVSPMVKLEPFLASYFRGPVTDGVPQGPLVPGTDVAQLLKNICTAFPPEFDMGMGVVMFPEEQETAHWNVLLPKDEPAPPNYMGQMLIAVCVSYGSTLDGRAQYHTAKALHLYKTSGDGNIPFGQPIAFDEL